MLIFLRTDPPTQEVCRIGLQLTEALQYIHEKGVVHRDLKPDNILIGPDGRVTLTDFGIALRLASRRLTFSHLSNAVGTPDYMAPEQVRGERGDPRSCSIGTYPIDDRAHTTVSEYTP